VSLSLPKLPWFSAASRAPSPPPVSLIAAGLAYQPNAGDVAPVIYRARLFQCDQCPHHRGVVCGLSPRRKSVLETAADPTRGCPDGRWLDWKPTLPAVSPTLSVPAKPGVTLAAPDWQQPAGRRPRVAFFLNDLAQGGIARFTVSLLRLLERRVDVAGIVFAHSFSFDADCARTLARFGPLFCPQPGEFGGLVTVAADAHARVLATADAVTVAGLSAEHSPLPEGLDWGRRPVLSQLHGVCDWTRKAVSYHRSFATAYWACSQTVADRVGDLCPTPPVVLPLPLEPDRLHTDHSRRSARLALCPAATAEQLARPWVVTLGRLAPEKRHALVASAVARLAGRGGVQPLTVVIGDGWDREPQLAAVRDADPAALLLGWRDDPAAVYRAADVVCCASTAEGGPLVVLEALAAGCPVVSAPVGIVQELRRRGASGRWESLVEVPDTVTPEGLATALAAVLDRVAGGRQVSEFETAQWVLARHTGPALADRYTALLTAPAGANS
jgi:glycosyltransferase involved in cell wall biosynthesis